jgi:hypothetical protein
VLIKVKFQIFAQGIDIAAACPQNFLTLFIKKDCVQDMLGSQKFMMPALGFPDCKGKGYLNILVKHVSRLLHYQ